MATDVIRVEGLRETLRQLQQLGAEVEDLKAIMAKAADLILAEARANAPVRTGALSGSLKPGKQKAKAVVRGGGARVPYAGVQEWGNPNTGLRGKGFLTGALQSKQGAAITLLENEMQDLINKLQLGG